MSLPEWESQLLRIPAFMLKLCTCLWQLKERSRNYKKDEENQFSKTEKHNLLCSFQWAINENVNIILTNFYSDELWTTETSEWLTLRRTASLKHHEGAKELQKEEQ